MGSPDFEVSIASPDITIAEFVLDVDALSAELRQHELMNQKELYDEYTKVSSLS